MKITPFSIKQIDEILPLLSANVPYVFPHHKYIYWILGEYFPSLCFVALDGGRVAGFVCAVHSAEKNAVFIWQLAVDAGSRGKGAATLLCNEIISCARENGAKSVQLTINCENTASIGFFTKFARKHGAELEKIHLHGIDDFDGEIAFEITWKLQ